MHWTESITCWRGLIYVISKEVQLCSQALAAIQGTIISVNSRHQHVYLQWSHLVPRARYLFEFDHIEKSNGLSCQ